MTRTQQAIKTLRELEAIITKKLSLTEKRAFFENRYEDLLKLENEIEKEEERELKIVWLK